MTLDTTTEPDQVVHGDIPESLFRAAVEAGSVSCDVETTGLEWQRHALATCQLAVPGGPRLVVTRIHARPARLTRLIADGSVQKLFHHAMFDLRFMAHGWEVRPQNIGCTKVEAKLLDPLRKSHSLKPLLAEFLGVEIDKALQKSDWANETLTPDQVAYALGDVAHLARLHEVLTHRLEERGLLDLYRRCAEHLPTRVQLELGGYPDVYAY